MVDISLLSVKAHDTARETVVRFRDICVHEKAQLPQADNVTETINAHLANLPIARL